MFKIQQNKSIVSILGILNSTQAFMKNLLVYTIFVIFTSTTIAETTDLSAYSITNAQANEITVRVNQMGVDELRSRKAYLENEAQRLEETKESSQNPSDVKEATIQLSLVTSELVYIVAALVGAGVILSDS